MAMKVKERGVYVDWEDGGQQMGVRGLVVSGYCGRGCAGRERE